MLFALLLAASLTSSLTLADWLPEYSYGGDPSHPPVRTGRVDSFTYQERPSPSGDLLGLQSPTDGTPFVDSPDSTVAAKGHVVYDYEHHIAFYDIGCCSWRSEVAAYGGPPPERVVARDLSTLRTIRGVRLGMFPSAVEAIYGANALHPVLETDRVFALAYTTLLKMPSSIRTPCEQRETFFFRDGRLILIQLGNGC